MKSIIVISYLLAVSSSARLLTVPHVTTTQYHSQDELGQYSYGYSGGPSAKEETRTADGVTRGSYNYVDANGILQSVSYVSDPVHGFRVSATNLPQSSYPVVTGASVVARAPLGVPAAPARVVAHPTVVPAAPGFDHVSGVPLETPEVVAAKAAHFAAHGEALARLTRRWKRSLAAPVAAAGKSYSIVTPSGSTTVVAAPFPSRSFSYSTVASAPLVSAAPAPIAVAPVASAVASAPAARSSSFPPAVAAPVLFGEAPLGSRYQAQDELGRYSYGYSDGVSSKTESRTADGVTHGRYSYLDSNGSVQSVKYIADAAGFRVHATNLPVAPTA